jgi:acetolactate synthase regulatory subunit
MRSQAKMQGTVLTGNRLPNQLAIGERSSRAKKLLSRQLSGLVSVKTVTDTTDTNLRGLNLLAVTVARASVVGF